MRTDLIDAEKRRFIKRETVPEPADLDAEPAGKINNQRTAIVADAVVNDNAKSVAATSSLLNGHTTVASQLRPSEETIDMNLYSARSS